MIKEGQQLIFIVEINTIVKFGKFQDDFNNFGLVVTRETVMALPGEDSLDAFIHEVRTNGVYMVVK